MNILATLALIIATPVIEDLFKPQIDSLKQKIKTAWKNHKDAKDIEDDED